MSAEKIEKLRRLSLPAKFQPLANLKPPSPPSVDNQRVTYNRQYSSLHDIKEEDDDDLPMSSAIRESYRDLFYSHHSIYRTKLDIDEKRINPPDGGYGWIIVFASFMCNFIVDGITYSFGIFFDSFVRHYHSSTSETALIGSLLSGCYMLAGPLVSYMSNMLGCRAVIIIGSFIAATGFYLSTFASNVKALLFLYGIMGGIGFGLIYLPSIVSVGFYFTSRRALATGIAVCGSGVGAFVFAPFCQYLLSVFDWQISLKILAFIALNGALFGSLIKPPPNFNDEDLEKRNQMMRDEKRKRKISTGKEPPFNNNNIDRMLSRERLESLVEEEEIDHQDTLTKLIDTEPKITIEVPLILSNGEINKTRKSPSKDWKLTVIKFFTDDIQFKLLSISNFIGMLAFYIPFVYLTQYCKERVYDGDDLTTPKKAALILSSIGILNILGRLVFGLISDRLSAREKTKKTLVDALFLNNCCLTAAGLIMITIPFIKTYLILALICSIFGISCAGYMGLTSIVIIDMVGLDNLSSSFGIISMFRGVGSMFGPPLAGMIYDLTGSFDWVFFSAGILFLISSVLSFLIPKTCSKSSMKN